MCVYVEGGAGIQLVGEGQLGEDWPFKKGGCALGSVDVLRVAEVGGACVEGTRALESEVPPMRSLPKPVRARHLRLKWIFTAVPVGMGVAKGARTTQVW